jgi:hypothetical protein
VAFFRYGKYEDKYGKYGKYDDEKYGKYDDEYKYSKHGSHSKVRMEYKREVCGPIHEGLMSCCIESC